MGGGWVWSNRVVAESGGKSAPLHPNATLGRYRVGGSASDLAGKGSPKGGRVKYSRGQRWDREKELKVQSDLGEMVNWVENECH